MWLIGSLGVDRRRLNAWRRLFHGGVFVEPHMPELREFREHFLHELQVIPGTDGRSVTVYGKDSGRKKHSSAHASFLLTTTFAIRHFSSPS